MKKIWGGSSDARDGDQRPSSARSARAEDNVAADEYTRLLPNRVESRNEYENANYLSPDDPAVCETMFCCAPTPVANRPARSRLTISGACALLDT